MHGLLFLVLGSLSMIFAKGAINQKEYVGVLLQERSY